MHQVFFNSSIILYFHASASTEKIVTCCLAPEVAGDWLHLALTWANTILQRLGRIIVGAGWSCPHRLEIQQAQKGCLIYTHVLVPKVSCHSHMYTHKHTVTHTQQNFTRHRKGGWVTEQFQLLWSQQDSDCMSQSLWSFNQEGPSVGLPWRTRE